MGTGTDRHRDRITADTGTMARILPASERGVEPVASQTRAAGRASFDE